MVPNRVHVRTISVVVPEALLVEGFASIFGQADRDYEVVAEKSCF